MLKILTTAQDKYYRYVPGEFMPVYMNGKLHNRKDFHTYKAKRFLWILKNYPTILEHKFSRQ